MVEQGTILDRIDFNIEHAKKDIKEGNKALEKVVKAETSTRAKSCLKFLIASITCSLITLIIKFS